MQRRHRDAAAWLATLGLCAFAIYALKTRIGYFDVEAAAGLRIRAAAFPSGHAGLGAAFYGGLAVLMWRARTGAADAGRAALAAAAAMLIALAILIAASVWILAWHFAIDIAGGALIGSACALLFAAALSCNGREHALSAGGVRRAALVLFVAAAVIGDLHGMRFDDMTLGRDFRLRIAGR
jgi:membrane-associated phospholipid phosphatase